MEQCLTDGLLEHFDLIDFDLLLGLHFLLATAITTIEVVVEDGAASTASFALATLIGKHVQCSLDVRGLSEAFDQINNYVVTLRHDWVDLVRYGNVLSFILLLDRLD